MKEKKVVKNKAGERPFMPFYTENKTIHKGGFTQVRLWLTREQAHSLYVFHKAIGIPYHVLVQIAVSEYVDKHLTDAEKKTVESILKTSRHRHNEMVERAKA